MGTIASRDALRVLQLSEQVAAAHLLATLQGLRLRERQGVLNSENYSEDLRLFLSKLELMIPFLVEDVPLEDCLRNIIAHIQRRTWCMYEMNSEGSENSENSANLNSVNACRP